MQVLEGHRGVVFSAEFALGGQLLFTGDASGTVIAWRAPSWQRHCAIAHKPETPIYCIAAGPGDVHFGRGTTVKQWAIGPEFLADFSSLKSFTLGDAHDKEVVPVVRTAKELITSGYDGQLMFWDVETGQARGGALHDRVMALAVTDGARYDAEAGGLLACGHEDGSLTMFDLAAYRPLGTIAHAHERDVYALSFQNVVFQRKLHVASISPADRVVRVWDGKRQVVELEGAGFTVAFRPDGRWLAHGHGNDIVIRDGATWEVVQTLRGHTGPISALAWSPIASLDDPWSGCLASGAHDGTVRVWPL
ncbi:MAG TPA: hypothetical protein VLX92_23560 [Kofleriaceae bacterium]|nr:hypothetical protein [Kofleriaceae bacterium]